ncbi:hypothetical protein MiAbW_02317 [Microcystis aeruginosa NIES-4325]|uniref:Uncharacterized protein n=1 Tax=Microcystis aeruginosa NIES-4325 TaxID=2569534 RepID=A0A5J4FCQ5_MICAE|nr:hypothetical protein MiAbW_02317 [Microcystis aeruginosa NIES-4325]
MNWDEPDIYNADDTHRIRIEDYRIIDKIQDKEMLIKYLSKINYTYLTTSCLLPFACPDM